MLCRVRLTCRSNADTTRQLLWSRRWCAIAQRRYASNADDHGVEKSTPIQSGDTSLARKDVPSRQSVLGTVTTNFPSRTTIERLLEAIASHDGHSQANVHSGESWKLSLLVTPSFAKHALDPSLPMKAWERIRGVNDEHSSLHAITAVVDRLPDVTGVEQGGKEGLSYYLTCEEQEGTILSDDMGAVTQRQVAHSDKPGTLNLIIPQGGASHYRTYTLQLPLAQTIFSTGKVSTMMHTHQNSITGLQSPTQTEWTSAAVRLPLDSADAMRTYIPLIPLTPARMVKHSVGNILRQISSCTISAKAAEMAESKPQPASTELEQAISKYFEAKDMLPETVGVWALIVPWKLARTGRLQSSASQLLHLNQQAITERWITGKDETQDVNVPSVVNAGIRKLMNEGARLCKVLSGGGGWGKKAGLLSLDPDTSYDDAGLEKTETEPESYIESNESNSTHDAGWETKSIEKEKARALGQFVEENDVVMFFLAPASLSDSHDSQNSVTDTNVDLDYVANAIQGTVFGTLSSSIDAMPASEKDHGEPEIVHTPNVFGMLSEGGMSLTISDPQQHNKTMSNGTFQTKFDVPYARFSIAKPTEEQLAKRTPKGKKNAVA